MPLPGASHDRGDVFDGVLRRAVAPNAPHVYFQDRHRRWPFHTGDRGAALLDALFPLARDVIARIDAAIDAACEHDAARSRAAIQRGVDLYARKPSIRERDVTWSQEEYRELGLQREYARFKSVQRFTETWACLERARAIGAFDAMARRGGGAATCASLGGGPGFELVAFREFFREHYPTFTLDLISLDVEDSWRASAEGLGLRFARWDMRDGDVAGACGRQVDFAIASYVFKMYMCEDVVADWLAEELKSIGAVFVINRDENLREGCALMESRGVDVARLLPQDNGRDDRQLIFSRGLELKPSVPTEIATHLTFPNVPYQEHKKSSDREQRPHGAWRPRDADRDRRPGRPPGRW